jgi:hypothetical protein
MRQRLFSFAFLFLIATSTVFAGILTPRGDAQLPIQILDHHVNVTILDGFSRTEVTQTFFHPNSVDLEAVYSTPLPSTAALSEVVVRTGETTIEGEVLTALEAEQIYDSEVARGRDAALAVKNEIFDFRFYVSPVREPARPSRFASPTSSHSRSTPESGATSTPASRARQTSRRQPSGSIIESSTERSRSTSSCVPRRRSPSSEHRVGRALGSRHSRTEVTACTGPPRAVG